MSSQSHTPIPTFHSILYQDLLDTCQAWWKIEQQLLEGKVDIADKDRLLYEERCLEKRFHRLLDALRG